MSIVNIFATIKRGRFVDWDDFVIGSGYAGRFFHTIVL